MWFDIKIFGKYSSYLRHLRFGGSILAAKKKKKKTTTTRRVAFRGVSVSRHHGGPIEGIPCNHRNITALWYWGVSRRWAQLGPKLPSLSDSQCKFFPSRRGAIKNEFNFRLIIYLKFNLHALPGGRFNRQATRLEHMKFRFHEFMNSGFMNPGFMISGLNSGVQT